jgi:putative SOS response-associated peptidase YedK
LIDIFSVLDARRTEEIRPVGNSNRFRHSITLPPEAIRQIFQTHGELPNWPASYNAAPTTALPVVRHAKDSGNRELVLMTWGLIP